MKIKLSKKQWEQIGEKTGWIKNAQNEESVEKISGKKERNKKDGTGPFEGSYQFKKNKKGKRKNMGESCPHEKKLDK